MSQETTQDGEKEPINMDISFVKPEKENEMEKEMDTTEEEMEKRKRKRRKLTKKVEDGYFLHITGVPDSVPHEIAFQFTQDETLSDYPNAKARIIDRELIQILPSEDERREIRRQYRQEYNRNMSAEERKQKIESEEAIAKRKAYNALPEVKERKKERAKERRKLLRLYQQQNPKLYNEYMGEKFSKKRKRTTEEPTTSHE